MHTQHTPSLLERHNSTPKPLHPPRRHRQRYPKHTNFLSINNRLQRTNISTTKEKTMMITFSKLDNVSRHTTCNIRYKPPPPPPATTTTDSVPVKGAVHENGPVVLNSIGGRHTLSYIEIWSNLGGINTPNAAIATHTSSCDIVTRATYGARYGCKKYV
jgi:hypothetical protein